MRVIYDSLAEFWRSQTNTSTSNVTAADLDVLEDKLRRDHHATIQETKRQKIVVHLPNDVSNKYLPQKIYGHGHYTKLSAAIPKEKAAAFSNACRVLGITQLNAILPTIDAVIEKASILTRTE